MCCPWCPFEEQSVGPFFVVVCLDGAEFLVEPFLGLVLGSWPLQGRGDRDEAFEIS